MDCIDHATYIPGERELRGARDASLDTNSGSCMFVDLC